MNLAAFPLSNLGLPKTWVSFGAQSFRIDTAFEMHRKNADAVVRATSVVLDGLNRIAERQGELLAAVVGDHVKVAHDVFTRASFGEKASNQAGAMRQLYDSGVASFREQSDIAAETNITVGDILNTRVSEALDECRFLFGKQEASAPADSAADAAVAEPVAGVDAVVVAEPAAGVGEAAAASEAALVEAVPIVRLAAKSRPKKASPPAKPARRR